MVSATTPNVMGPQRSRWVHETCLPKIWAGEHESGWRGGGDWTQRHAFRGATRRNISSRQRGVIDGFERQEPRRNNPTTIAYGPHSGYNEGGAHPHHSCVSLQQ
ncbi:unnamed protein product, partial [Ectocarpus fasciculatus]